MNHYPHHIGDFNNATRHLTRVERSLYRDLLDVYYDSERPLPADDFERLARRVLALSEDEKAALRAVLSEFFTLQDGVYRNARCDLEIEKYQSFRQAASRAGKASVQARLNRKSTRVKRPLNARATNQNRKPEPEPSNISAGAKKTAAKKLNVDDLVIEGVPKQAAEDWMTVRKEKHAPLTQSALDGVRVEAAKAGISLADAVTICAKKSWQGFNASWDWQDSMPKKTALQLLEEEDRRRATGSATGSLI